jgi:TetR/AcrR family transcriptional regulator, transcriptional repressor of bet genes
MVIPIPHNSPKLKARGDGFSTRRLVEMNELMKVKTVPRFRRVLAEERKAMLIEAALSCLAKGGIRAFTVDNICREAGTSRGLIVHHFGSKDALLTAAYTAVYDRLIETVETKDAVPLSLGELVEQMCSPANFERSSLNVWLALWGEIASNPALQVEHRKHYALFREKVARCVGEAARAKGIVVDSYAIAISFIALLDGLWLEQCIDPKLLSTELAKDACYRMLESVVGPIRRTSGAN